MDAKNKLQLEINIVPNDRTIKIEGISFSGIAYIVPYIDDANLFDNIDFSESFLIFDELRKSTVTTGRYLIFTSVSGIADDAGWGYVKVVHHTASITWLIERDEKQISFEFDKTQYINSIASFEGQIERVDLVLEPQHVIFPE